jgi:hypothetical protein
MHLLSLAGVTRNLSTGLLTSPSFTLSNSPVVVALFCPLANGWVRHVLSMCEPDHSGRPTECGYR